MNAEFFKHAMEIVDTMTDDQLSDAMAAAGMEHTIKLKTRFLRFSYPGIPSELSSVLYPVLNEQLGHTWNEIYRAWRKTHDTYKSSHTIIHVVVADEAAEVLIRLCLPSDIKMTSSDEYVNNDA